MRRDISERSSVTGDTGLCFIKAAILFSRFDYDLLPAFKMGMPHASPYQIHSSLFILRQANITAIRFLHAALTPLSAGGFVGRLYIEGASLK